MTGPTPKLGTCNTVWSKVLKTYYIDYFDLFNEVVFTENFKTANRRQSIRLLLTYFENSLKWPHEMLYPCYWGSVTLYDEYSAQDFPNVMHYKDPDGTWIQYDLYSQAAMNALFNLGYQVMDVIYLLIVWGNEPDYWYRTGFVGGDIYMRYFYRNLYDVPVR